MVYYSSFLDTASGVEGRNVVIFKQITELGSGDEPSDEIARRTCNLKVRRT